jgi:glutamate formiminotransferase/formiminotetrahydrofolate cyclodeaminase
MNLTDFEQTPMHRVFESVRSEAARHGFSIVSSEIIGLVPKKALEQVAEWFLQVENFDSSLILENRLNSVMTEKIKMTGGAAAAGGLRAGVEPFIEQLAAPTATPGGGSAAAASGAMAAGLAAMVASMSLGKKAYAQYQPQLSEAISRLSQLREELKTSIDADAESYKSVMGAYKKAKESTSSDGIVDAALKQATSVPLSVAEQGKEVLQVVDSLGPITNPNMKSDLVTAAALARAAIEGALANVEINLESLKDEGFVAQVRGRAGALKA